MLEYRTEYLIFEAPTLLADYPPGFVHPNKVAVYKVGGPQTKGTINVSRWREMPLPVMLPPKRSAKCQSGFYPYSEDRSDVWVNFADPNLFGFYGTPLFAQDEMQVLEHPALASIREALEDMDVPTLTVENGQPTPVYIEGVERRVAIDVDPCPTRPHGLYGRYFSLAPRTDVRAATERLTPTLSNILAIAAPCGGRGNYTKEEMQGILSTAYTGFAPLQGKTIHSGFWGCGAFGGNRMLMVILQVLAARLAGVDIVLHYGDSSGKQPCAKALAFTKTLTGSVDSILDDLVGMEFKWRVGNGT